MNNEGSFKRFWQTIKVKVRGSKIGTDGFNKPIYSYVQHSVDKVLIRPEAGLDIASDGTRLEGRKLRYSIAIPKDCNLDFENAKVKVGNEWCRVIGAPRVYPESVTNYHQIVYLEQDHG